QGEEAIQLVRRECVTRDRSQGRGRDTAAPQRLTQPVADLRRESLDVDAELVADPAHHLVAQCDREVRLGLRLEGVSQPALGIGVRVGMGEAVAQLQPNIAVIAVADDALLVPALPRTHHTDAALQAHCFPSLTLRARNAACQRAGRTRNRIGTSARKPRSCVPWPASNLSVASRLPASRAVSRNGTYSRRLPLRRLISGF